MGKRSTGTQSQTGRGIGAWASDLYTFLSRRRPTLIALTALILAGAFLMTLNLKLDKSLKALLPDSSATLGQSIELLDLAPFSRVMLVQLTAESPEAVHLLASTADMLIANLDSRLLHALSFDDNIPEPAELMALLPALCDESCLDRLAEFEDPQKTAQALTDLKNALSGPGGLSNFFWRADPLDWRGELLRHFPRTGGWPQADPLTGYPQTRDGRHLLIILQPQVSMNDTAGAEKIMTEIESSLTGIPPGVSAQVVGAHRHTAANASAIERDLALTMSLALLLILGIYLLLVRSFGAFWLFLTPVVAVMLAAAGLSLAFPLISGLALGFGAGVLGIAEDYAVHVHFALRRAPGRTEALKHVARPLLMSTVLCVAGFGVLLFSSIPAIRQLAFFSAAAIMVGYLWAIVVLPHCPGMDKPREFNAGRRPEPQPGQDSRGASAASTDNSGHLPAWTSAEAPFGPAESGKVHSLPAFLILAVFSAFLLNLVPASSSIRDLGLTDPAIVRDQESIENNWRLDGGRLVFLAEGHDYSEALNLAAQLTLDLNAVRPGSAVSLAGLIPNKTIQGHNLANWRVFQSGSGRSIIENLAREAERQNFSIEAFQPFKDWFSAEARPNNSESLAQAGMGLLAENFLASKDGRFFAVVISEGPPSSSPQPGQWAAEAAVIDEQLRPGSGFISQPSFLPEKYSGRIFQLSAAEMEEALSKALGSEKRLLPICLIICLSILSLAFKNLNLALLAFIPALGGLAAVLLVQIIAGRPVGLVEAAALPLVICLGADYGIVVVSELKESADLGAPMAIFVSGLSTLAGIGILILASHPVLHSLGRTVFIGLSAAMPISILLLPKLWKK